MSLKNRIINGDATIGIVGLGYIGFSTAAHYANAGANVIGVDLDKDKVESFNKGTVYIDNIEYWLGFPSHDRGWYCNKNYFAFFKATKA